MDDKFLNIDLCKKIIIIEVNKTSSKYFQTKSVPNVLGFDACLSMWLLFNSILLDIFFFQYDMDVNGLSDKMESASISLSPEEKLNLIKRNLQVG